MFTNFHLKKSNAGLMKLAEKVEMRSENAHHIILNCNGKVFQVSRVRVHLSKGNLHKATFYAREEGNSPPKDLAMEIPQSVYEALLKYASLDNPDLILVLQVQGNEFQCGITSKSWFKRYSSKENLQYVV